VYPGALLSTFSAAFPILQHGFSLVVVLAFYCDREAIKSIDNANNNTVPPYKFVAGVNMPEVIWPLYVVDTSM